MSAAAPIAGILTRLAAREDLPREVVQGFLRTVMDGAAGDAEVAGFLIGLRVKGETAAEMAAAAEVLRERMTAWAPGRDVVDTCGTGGDGLATFNVSTATAFVLAGAGVAVVKHGNRSVSSRSGSADVLSQLGAPQESDPDFLRRCLAETNLAFCFAPLFHPAMKHVAAVRRALGVPTLFNCLGPLANPAGARRQLLGVGRRDLLDRMAGALALLGTTRSLVVCSDEGLDEVSLSSPTQVRLVTPNGIEAQVWRAADFGLAPVALADLAADDPASSARTIRSIFAGDDTPAARVVVANTAAGLWLAERVATLAQGAELARETLRSGRAQDVLARLIALKR